MEIFTFRNDQGKDVYCYKWGVREKGTKGIIQIAHGMAEWSGRYDRFAHELLNSGYMVYANDHRGHGRTAGSLENKGQIGEDGFKGMIRDMKVLNEIIRRENANLPVFLFGHSMGSFLTQGYISLYGDSLDGAILSGTRGPQPLITRLGLLIAKAQAKLIGFEASSKLLTKMAFGRYNNRFKPIRTEYDWLSRDKEEVDAYINDPWCGGVFPAGFYFELFKGLVSFQNKNSIKNIPKGLPIYMFSGDMDPVCGSTKTIVRLIEKYRSLGIENIEYKFYKNGRHEMLNEINRDEVTRDIIEWLKRQQSMV